MGIHYDYKSTRGDKAMKKEAKRKARIEQRRAKRTNNSKESEEKLMHDIDKPITLEDLTNPDKNQSFEMKSFEKKDSLLKNREIALKKNLKKRKKIITEKKRKNDSSFRQMD